MNTDLHRGLGVLVIALTVTFVRTAHADEPPPPTPTQTVRAQTAPPRHLALTVGVVDVASPGANGGAIAAGLRLRPFRYFETSLDLAYGLLDGARGPEDRWWVIPNVALVIPVGRLTWDVGAGLGVGTVSAYNSWSSYFAAPFTPRWHYTAPAARAHTGIAVPVAGPIELFLRAELATILVAPQDFTDTVSFGLTIGVQGWVL